MRAAPRLPALLLGLLLLPASASGPVQAAPPDESSAASVDTSMTASVDKALAAPMDTALGRAMSEGHLAARRDGTGALRPGPVHRIGSVTLTGPGSTGPGAFTPEALGLAGFPGRPATARELAALADRVRAHLLDHGRPFAEAALDFSVRADAPVVDLRLDLRPGAGYKHGGLRQAGSRTRPDVLERLSLLEFGEDWSESRLRLAQRRLARTGYYESVAPGPLYRDSTRNLLYPTVSLVDLKGNRLGGILGYDSEKGGEGGLNGYLDVHLINIRGTARDLDFAFESKTAGEGTDEKEARLAYTEPWLLGSALGATASLDLALQDSVYDEANAALELFQDLGFQSRYSIHLALQGNRDWLAGTRTSAYSTGLGLRYDARDRVPGTLRGMRLEGKVSGVRRDLGDSSYYLVQTVQSAGLWANRGRWVAHLLASGGGNWPLSERADRGDLFPLGGANTIRGFREKEFLTDLYLYANAEIQFLLAPWSRAAVFAVPALVNRPGGEVHWMRRIGYGLGLEAGGRDWTFGLSYALNPDRDPGDGFVHLRVTNNF